MNTNNTAVAKTSNFLPFPQMVENLFKALGTDEATLMHATVGMSGEAAELLAGLREHYRNPANNETLDNLVEELGDWRFYAQKVWTIYGWEWDSFALPPVNDTDDVQELSITFTIGSGDVLDISKKSWVYAKELDALKLYDAMVVAVAAYRDMLVRFGWTDEFICDVNQTKLAKRYPNGVYSNADAIARADKIQLSTAFGKNCA